MALILIDAQRCAAALLAGAILSSCGGGGSDPGNTAPAPPAPVLEMLAGITGGEGYLDGQGGAAKFWYPQGLAVDASGTIYVSDAGNRVIRKITPQGLVTTLAGAAGQGGFVDGTGTAARFGASGRSIYGPRGIAVDLQGNVYVADAYNNSIRLVTPAGAVSTLAGTGQKGSADGPAPSATFSFPVAVAVDKAGNVYVADADNGLIRRISPARVVTTLAHIAGALISLAVDDAGNLYIADWTQQVIRKLSADGVVTTFAGTLGVMGSADGPASSATFYAPTALALGADASVYVAEAGNRLVRKISSAGMVSTIAGNTNGYCSIDGVGAAAQFSGPSALAIAPAGALYVAEVTSVIREIGPGNAVTTIAGTTVNCASRDATGADARFGGISDIAVDANGTLEVVDRGARAVRKVNPAGQVTTTTTTVGHPWAVIAIDRTGVAYVGAYEYPGICRPPFNSCDPSGFIRRIGPTGEVTAVDVVASSDGTGTVINTFGGIAVDAEGNLYWTDPAYHTVRRRSAGGDVTTLAGARGLTGASDGAGPAARFNQPTGILIDGAGNLYVADRGNHTVRKIARDATVTTIAGSAGTPGSADGVGIAARFDMPYGLALDPAGNIYVADLGNSVVRKFSPSGLVTTVVGAAGQQRFVPGPLPGMLDAPFRVAVFGSDLYIAMTYGIAVVHNRP